MDLEPHERNGTFYSEIYVWWRENKFKSRMVRNIGPPNLAVISAEGILIIIEWHNFTGADWDGKFMVATKKRSVHRVLQTNHTPANLALRHP